MGAYRLQHSDTELESLIARAESGEEISIERDGAVVARIIPFRAPSSQDEAPQPKRRGGQNLFGLAGTDLSWLDEPLPEDMQRAFGMID